MNYMFYSFSNCKLNIMDHNKTTNEHVVCVSVIKLVGTFLKIINLLITKDYSLNKISENKTVQLNITFHHQFSLVFSL